MKRLAWVLGVIIIVGCNFVWAQICGSTRDYCDNLSYVATKTFGYEEVQAMQRDDFPSYESLKKAVELSDKQVQQLKHMRRSLKGPYEDLFSALESMASEKQINYRISQLDIAYVQAVDLRKSIGVVVTDIYLVNQVDLKELGWTDSQIEESKKWEKLMHSMLDKVKEINKISPTDNEVERLLMRAGKQ